MRLQGDFTTNRTPTSHYILPVCTTTSIVHLAVNRWSTRTASAHHDNTFRLLSPSCKGIAMVIKCSQQAEHVRESGEYQREVKNTVA